ncbi:MAG: glycosyltransferase family 2 protein [Oscillatoriophycideae cyanobacterium NC_groundwater_1537_Pr4_S-0.65um_50_18]|nr:glycosyltransferase family 2 protein [Oscillatoriophycideae cyanobacterium NC_groundwater_1537_Pr4_S-0.65um_50_18]
MGVKISVVVPAYNAVQDLSQTLESVLQQTFTDFELLVVDDGSTDDTAKIVQDYVERDSRVRLVSQYNQGVSVARNTGIQESTGEFVAFLDHDDLWLPNKLAAHVQHLSLDANLGISFARIEFMNADGELTGQYSNLRLRNIMPKHLYEENLICTPSNAVIRRTALEQVGGFEKSLSGYADIELFLRISCYEWKVEGLDDILVRYRTNATGMSAQLCRMEEEWYRFSNQVNTYAPTLVAQNYSRARAMLLRYLARRALRIQANPSVGVNFINRALVSDWKILLREPRRTFLTASTVYGQCLLSMASAKEYLVKG